MEVSGVLAQAGGAASLLRLRESGWSARAIQRAAERGELVRVRRGWYAAPGADPRVIVAVRSGGAIGCVTACGIHGLWDPLDPRIHVVVPRTAGRVHVGARDVCIEWVDRAGRGEGLVGLPESLARAVRCAEPAVAFALVESAFRVHGPVDWITDLIATTPQALRRELEPAGWVSESGSESIAAYRLRRSGFSFAQQVRIPGIGRVDFLVDERLIVEVDSEAFHGSPHQRRTDLRRDVHAAALGLRTLRLDYWQVLDDWDYSELAIRRALGARLRGPLTRTRPSVVANGG